MRPHDKIMRREAAEPPRPGRLFFCAEGKLSLRPALTVKQLMTQSEVERAVSAGAVGSGYRSERVTCRHPAGVWDVHLRCAECGPFRFLVIEQMDDVPVPVQVEKEIERHSKRH